MDIMPLFMVFVLSWPEAVLVSLFGLQLVGIKPKIPYLLLAGLLQAFSSYLIRALPIDYGYHTIIHLIFYALIIWLVLKIPYIVAQVATLIGFTCYLALESAALPLSLHIIGLNMEQVLSQPHLRIIAFIPQALIFLAVVLIIRKKDISFYKLTILPGQKLISMNINEKTLPLILLIIIQPFFLILLNTSNFLTTVYSLRTITAHNFAIGVLSVVLTVAALLFVKQIVRAVKQETESRMQLENMKNIQEMVHTMRSQRHDFNNHIQTVYGLINIGAYEEAKEYMNDVIVPVQSSNKLLSDNSSITALLQVKANIAESKGIKTDFSITGSLKAPVIPVRDLNTILGNLIDNAIEATESHNGRKLVEVKIISGADNIMVTVFNTGPKIHDQVKHKIFAPGFTTKKTGQGIGLSSVKKIVDNYSGSMEVINEAEGVRFSISIGCKYT